MPPAQDAACPWRVRTALVPAPALSIAHDAAYVPAMGTAFIKMHGCGNDFAIFDARQTAIAMPPARVRRLADRHRGIGCDQLILIEPSTRADLFMRIFNPDGTEAEACGNATRCVAHLVGGEPVIETRAGLLPASADAEGITIRMGAPRFAWDAVPLSVAMDTADMPVGWGPLERPVALSMGNPHVVFFVSDPAAISLATMGPEIEADPLFPERVNVNVAAVRSRTHIDLLVWERGAGLTLACGSGACATFAAARRRRLVDATASVALPGGTLTIREATDGGLLMTGPVATSFLGETSL